MRYDSSTACGEQKMMLVSEGEVVFGFGKQQSVWRRKGRFCCEVDVASGSSRREVGLGQERSVSVGVQLCFVFQRPDTWGASRCASVLLKPKGAVHVGDARLETALSLVPPSGVKCDLGFGLTGGQRRRARGPGKGAPLERWGFEGRGRAGQGRQGRAGRARERVAVEVWARLLGWWMGRVAGRWTVRRASTGWSGWLATF
jgi:hypothetical protein